MCFSCKSFRDGTHDDKCNLLPSIKNGLYDLIDFKLQRTISLANEVFRSHKGAEHAVMRLEPFKHCCHAVAIAALSKEESSINRKVTQPPGFIECFRNSVIQCILLRRFAE